LGARKSTGLNRVAKIGEGHLCLSEKNNLVFIKITRFGIFKLFLRTVNFERKKD
jgi:hypothetical protein